MIINQDECTGTLIKVKGRRSLLISTFYIDLKDTYQVKESKALTVTLSPKGAGSRESTG